MAGKLLLVYLWRPGASDFTRIMVKANENYSKLAAGYLFPEIAKRTRAYAAKNKKAKIVKLGIGDTTEPLPPVVLDGLLGGAKRLGKRQTYTGYCPDGEQGDLLLRQRIAELKYKGAIDADEIFVSDGAKPDAANIQEIFSADARVAVQDPAYPVYVDSSVMNGRTGPAKGNGQYEGIIYMPCTEGNSFFPELPKQKPGLIYLCSPNNPTGAVTTREQLKVFVDYARKEEAVIIFDAAYERFISDASLPHSIYEVQGAKECAIEIGSFSKEAGFTGVRLGWTVVPKELKSEEGEAALLNRFWNRRQSTRFNGASNIAQAGGLAVLSKKGQAQTQNVIDYYMNNARLISKGLSNKGLTVYGGENAPYIWAKTPGGIASWDLFDQLLKQVQVVVTPGTGFGPSGEGFFRLTAFGALADVEEAMERIKDKLEI